MSTIQNHLSTAEVASRAGIHKDTLLRWLRTALVPEPHRDRHGWRYFTPAEAEAIVAFARQASEPPAAVNVVSEPRLPYLTKLKEIDWDFADAKTNYLTHGLHPYPAKFIPQIPNALIQELSSVGDTVADIFCGSGTTLVEALTLKRHAVGIDANPLACLISRAKISSLSAEDVATLNSICTRSRQLAEQLSISQEAGLFPQDAFTSPAWRPRGKILDFWFTPWIVEELSECLCWSRDITSFPARNLALVTFSSIVVAVSKQDSDTRYVRREKNLKQGDVFRRFGRALELNLRAAIEFSELLEPRFTCSMVNASLLDKPEIPPIDLAVCSPPYPNAYSYHLYHMTRMLWLGMDQAEFKQAEIGSHRKYSSKSKHAPTIETFKNEFRQILGWLSQCLKQDGFACFIVGNSTVKGEHIDNADLISAAGKTAGFREVMRLNRNMKASKKSFNPAIGKIKTETILILQNTRIP